MYFKRFQQGDKVVYSGSKFASELSGKLGYVVGRVDGTQQGVVVDFGEHAYILNEAEHLDRFQGKDLSVKLSHSDATDLADKKVGNTEVQKRKGVGGGKKFTHKDNGK
jgi:hypothetical protein